MREVQLQKLSREAFNEHGDRLMKSEPSLFCLIPSNQFEKFQATFSAQKSVFVLFSVIQVGIAEPELANSSLEVWAFEVIKPKT